MIRTVKIGEVQTEMIGDISTADVMNIFLRVGWGAETTSRIAFKPAEDLNAGDGIMVTIEKVYEEPEPEPVEEAAAGEVAEAPEAEVGEEALADETAEALTAREKKEASVDEAAETSTSEAEGGEKGTASEAAEENPAVEDGEEGTAEKI